MGIYKVEGDEIREIVDGKITGVWKKGDISEGVKMQLIERGGKEVEKFFVGKKETPLAGATSEKSPVKKKVVKKRSK